VADRTYNPREAAAGSRQREIESGDAGNAQDEED
jgi:hypothetical protein